MAYAFEPSESNGNHCGEGRRHQDHIYSA